MIVQSDTPLAIDGLKFIDLSIEEQALEHNQANSLHFDNYQQTTLSIIIQGFNHTRRRYFRSIVFFPSLRLASTTWTAISDLVFILRLSWNREDRARRMSQRSRHDGDLQRREFRRLNRTPIVLKITSSRLARSATRHNGNTRTAWMRQCRLFFK
jgi:hypothetical protein